MARGYILEIDTSRMLILFLAIRRACLFGQGIFQLELDHDVVRLDGI